MSRLLEHFDRELEILQQQNEELVIQDFIPTIRNIIEIFSSQGHSGSSASAYSDIIASTLKKVLRYKPLSPITCLEHEWNDTTEMSESNPVMFQNNRECAVFKDGTYGEPYYLDAIAFSGEEEYDTFTGTVEGITSSQTIRIPFTPKTFYIDVIKKPYVECGNSITTNYYEHNNEKYYYVIKDRSQLEEVKKYYVTNF